MNKLAYLLLLPLVAAYRSASSPDLVHAGTGAAWATVPERDALSLRPVRWTVVGGNAERKVTAGRAVSITVQADIANGWHIYSLTQESGGPRPLRPERNGRAHDVRGG